MIIDQIILQKMYDVRNSIVFCIDSEVVKENKNDWFKTLFVKTVKEFVSSLEFTINFRKLLNRIHRDAV